MPRPLSEQPLLKAKILAVLLKLADDRKDVDFKSESIKELWALGDHNVEDYLFELSEQRAIYFESVGEDGFAPIMICSVTKETPVHLLRCLAEISNDKNLLDARIQSLLQHDPNRLKADIAESERHIKQAQAQLATNPILAPLQNPLKDIERHFESIRRVAENYDDIYKNILKPVQEEGRSGIRATVKWAIIGIVASWLLSNYESILKLITSLRSTG
jgi:hypothetical protein